MPITPVVFVGNAKLQLKFLIVETPLDPLPNFVADPINTSLLTTFMLGIATVSTPMVVILALSD
jgi:hypothetical protein